MKVLVADKISPKGVALLRQQPGLEVVEAYGSSPEKVLELVKDVHAIAVRSETKITAEVFAAAPAPVTEVFVAPAFLCRQEPAYPERARRAGAEGVVGVRLALAADGSVRQVELTRSSGSRLLDEAALQDGTARTSDALAAPDATKDSPDKPREGKRAAKKRAQAEARTAAHDLMRKRASGGKLSGEEARDLLGRVYEYFLTQFASAEGKNGGQFYTPSCVVRLLVEMLAPYKGRIYDPACGSGGMFVQSEKFVESHGGKLGDIAIYGQESNPTTWKLAIMNLAIRGIEGRIEQGDTLHNDRFPDLKADFVIANPPFNISDWWHPSLDGDSRWVYGTPPQGNANYAWLQHILHHLKPTGRAGIVLANGSMSSNTNNEGEIRKKLIEDDFVKLLN